MSFSESTFMKSSRDGNIYIYIYIYFIHPKAQTTSVSIIVDNVFSPKPVGAKQNHPFIQNWISPSFMIEW